MASIGTYAKLIKPPQFAANESATFRFEYSRDLSCMYATLRVYDYFLGYYNKSYECYTQTHYINTSVSGTGIEEYIVPPNSLGQLGSDEDIVVNTKGKMKAVIEIGNELDDEGNAIPLYRSNEIIVDMVWWFEGDYSVDIVDVTSSTSTFMIQYTPRDSVGSYGSCDVNSYQALLYDENYNLINQTEEFYDWNNYDRAKKISFSSLSDKISYYIRSKITLVGGYTRYSDFVSFTVNYAPSPTLNSELELSNNLLKGCVNIKFNKNIAHTKAVLSRAEVNSNDYLQLRTIGGNISNATLTDYYALPNKSYIYRLTLYNGDEIVDTYYNSITHKMSGLCIADSQGAFSTEIFESFPIQKNDRSTIIEVMDDPKPYSIVNSSVDYDSGGNISAKFTQVDNDCSYNFNPDGNANATISEKARHWLNNGRTKLLKIDNGECWLVTTNGVGTTYNYKEGGLGETTFGWTEIADVHSNEAYLEEELIIIE